MARTNKKKEANKIDEELKSTLEPKIKKIFSKKGLNVTISLSKKYNWISVHIENSYGKGVDLTFNQLTELSKMFGTELIDITDYTTYDGCETCDYGATSEITIDIKEANFDD